MGTQMRLDPGYLSKIARRIALEVAAENGLFLSPEALPAVDDLVVERAPGLEKLPFNLDRWKAHVRGVCSKVALVYVSRRVRRVVDRSDLLGVARPAVLVYPYDFE